MVAVIFLTAFQSYAQIDIGISGVPNILKSNGTYFRSAPKIGFQLGVLVSYHLNDYFALKGEPSFNISRIRTNQKK